MFASVLTAYVLGFCVTLWLSDGDYEWAFGWPIMIVFVVARIAYALSLKVRSMFR